MRKTGIVIASVLLCIFMACSCSLDGNLQEINQVGIDLGFAGGNGTSRYPLLISTEAQLKMFQASVNAGDSYIGKAVALSDSITLQDDWIPIGASARAGDSLTAASTPFKGVFDGKGKTISGMRIDASVVSGTENGLGFFSAISGSDTVVRNLVIDDGVINQTDNRASGLVAGLVLDGATIQNCKTTATSSVTASTAGGIVGRMLKKGTIIGCENNAPITVGGTDKAGGIIGTAYYDQDTTGTATRDDFIIKDCLNNGTITGSGYIGGIVGYGTTIDVLSCTNAGAVNATSGGSTGGIIGEFGYGGKVDGCINSGTITVSGGAIGNTGTGGIVGWIRYQQNESYNDTQVCTVRDSHNTGIVTVNANNGVGGVVGMVYWAATIDGCTNNASITNTSGNMTGGVIGGLQWGDGKNHSENRDNTILVENCSALTGSGVDSTGTNTGAFIGHVYVPSEDLSPEVRFISCVPDGEGSGIPAALIATK